MPVNKNIFSSLHPAHIYILHLAVAILKETDHLILIDLTDYSILPNSLVSMLTYFSMSSTDEGYIPIFSYTKLFLVDFRPNNKVVFSRTGQET